MKKYTFDEIREKGLLIYEYIRGSHCHGINTPTSDIDHGGVYLAPAEQLLGLGLDYQEQIENETHDDVWFELNKFMNLLLKSNPTVLEALFIDEKYIIYEHPIMTEIKKHRDMFVTQKCFNSFGGYAVSQIRKARGLNKKIVNPIVERRGMLSFAYTFPEKVEFSVSEGNIQGSTKIEHWLEFRGLEQKYCGLVNIANMKDTYGVFYDWGTHIQEHGISAEDLWNDMGYEDRKYSRLARYIATYTGYDHPIQYRQFCDFVYQKPLGYRGMVKEGVDSNELRLSSVAKGVKPICWMQYNKDGYTQHCRKYAEYKEWERDRNKVRYESNLNKNYDSKNMCECFRLVQMCIEIANGEGFKCDRSGIDRDFLLDIKAHKFEYDELMGMLIEKQKEMDEAISRSLLREDIDVDMVNELLLKIRKEQIGLS